MIQYVPDLSRIFPLLALDKPLVLEVIVSLHRKKKRDTLIVKGVPTFLGSYNGQRYNTYICLHTHINFSFLLSSLPLYLKPQVYLINFHFSLHNTMGFILALAFFIFVNPFSINKNSKTTVFSMNLFFSVPPVYNPYWTSMRGRLRESQCISPGNFGWLN